MNIEIRNATPRDLKDIKRILSFYCLDTEKMEENLPGFKVAILDGMVVACACLDRMDIVELRSIAVLPAHRNRGIGNKLVDSILDRAVYLTDKVYLRTTSPEFFGKKGFIRLPDAMKKAIFKDCAECDKFDKCTQTLMEIKVPKNPN